jgi:hypothetical protein
MKLDALKANSQDFKQDATTSDIKAAQDADLLREQAIEIAALLKELLGEIDAAVLSSDIANLDRELVDSSSSVRRPGAELRAETDVLRRALQDALDSIDRLREPGPGLQEEALENIESWARQRRGDVAPEDREPLR